MRSLALYAALLVLAAAVPCFSFATPPHRQASVPFVGWPELEPGVTLPTLPVSETERGFARSFPGRIAKFGDARRQYIVRFITSPTRRVHPAEDCFRASGFAIEHLARCPKKLSGSGACFIAEKDGSKLTVEERITDRDQKTFADVSAWYWAAVRGTSVGPWWSVTRVGAE